MVPPLPLPPLPVVRLVVLGRLLVVAPVVVVLVDGCAAGIPACARGLSVSTSMRTGGGLLKLRCLLAAMAAVTAADVGIAAAVEGAPVVAGPSTAPTAAATAAAIGGTATRIDPSDDGSPSLLLMSAAAPLPKLVSALLALLQLLRLLRDIPLSHLLAAA